MSHNDAPINFTVRPKVRRVIISGDEAMVQLRNAIVEHVGVVADIIDLSAAFAAMLEEYFYGVSFQDPFKELLSDFIGATEKIEDARKAGLKEISRQMNLALGEIKPSCQYAFEMMGEDLLIMESPPIPIYRSNPL